MSTDKTYSFTCFQCNKETAFDADDYIIKKEILFEMTTRKDKKYTRVVVPCRHCKTNNALNIPDNEQ
jgi:hypothetical protein